jgi:uroporphyrinogen decarboxylase
MTSRERVLRAIDHRDVDRVPCLFRAEEEVQARVREAFGLRGLVEITRYFGAGTVQASEYPALPDLARLETVEELERLAWPGAHDTDVEGYVQRVAEARATELAVLGGAWATIFTGPRRQMGEAKFLMAMMDEPEFIARVVEKTADCYLEVNEAVFSRCAKDIDVFYFGSDFGTQRSLFIGGEAFRRFFKPHLARLAAHAKGFGLRVMFHTCGAVSEIIPDLIECGIDVLDPVQASARGMAPRELAARFRQQAPGAHQIKAEIRQAEACPTRGAQIAFHGGISTQTTLPHGTPEEVRAEVRDAIDALGPTGYICGPDQEMIGDTPVENVVAMYEEIGQEVGK